jgi:hypothetical protein
MSTQVQCTPEEIARSGQEIYDRELRPRLEPTQKGRFVVIDVVSHDYEIDDDDLAASDRLLARNPGAVLYGVRIGYVAAYRLGRRAAADRL